MWPALRLPPDQPQRKPLEASSTFQHICWCPSRSPQPPSTAHRDWLPGSSQGDGSIQNSVWGLLRSKCSPERGLGWAGPTSHLSTAHTCHWHSHERHRVCFPTLLTHLWELSGGILESNFKIYMIFLFGIFSAWAQVIALSGTGVLKGRYIFNSRSD